MSSTDADQITPRVITVGFVYAEEIGSGDVLRIEKTDWLAVLRPRRGDSQHTRPSVVRLLGVLMDASRPQYKNVTHAKRPLAQLLLIHEITCSPGSE